MADTTAFSLNASTLDDRMMRFLTIANRVAHSQLSLLITGEVGCGKREFAHAIHKASDRAQAPLHTVRCRSDGEGMESELFGANAGVEKSDQATLLLEEIGNLPLHLQPRLVRLLKEREFERKDDFIRRTANVRILATSAVDLNVAVQHGLFRGDLLEALSVVQLEIPPLRQRRADIPVLANDFLALLAAQYHRSIKSITPAALHALNSYVWPGNVCELKNIIERAVLLCDGDRIDVLHLPSNLTNRESSGMAGDLIPLEALERFHICRVVAASQSLRQAASVLQIDPGTLVRKMKKYKAQENHNGHRNDGPASEEIARVDDNQRG